MSKFKKSPLEKIGGVHNLDQINQALNPEQHVNPSKPITECAKKIGGRALDYIETLKELRTDLIELNEDPENKIIEQAREDAQKGVSTIIHIKW